MNVVHATCSRKLTIPEGMFMRPLLEVRHKTGHSEGERGQGGRERLGLKVGERDDIASKNNLGNHLISDLPQRNFW